MKNTRNWTWDTVFHYHRCPHCGFVTESRERYIEITDRWIKDLVCPRCKSGFQVSKKK